MLCSSLNDKRHLKSWTSNADEQLMTSDPKPKETITHLLIDTSCLWDAGSDFNHSDFRKLLEFSKSGELKIFIPHIVWEERRTQLLEKLCAKVRAITESFEELKTRSSGNLLLQGLTPLTFTIWNKAEIDATSKKVMADFAAENKIVIVPFAHDHANRAWERYFNVDPPFNPAVVDRTTRRKDIPDSWIFEVALDLHHKHSGLSALCHDGGLADAMRSIGIRVFKEFGQVLAEIENLAIEEVAVETIAVRDAVSVPLKEKAEPAVAQDALGNALAEVQEQFKDLETKILGFIGYLGTPSKDELFALLSKSGVSANNAKHVAERLAITGLVTDTGNHYLSKNKEASDLAATIVEPEIIKLLEE
jgi:predicted nucleic acid-binding protein